MGGGKGAKIRRHRFIALFSYFVLHHVWVFFIASINGYLDYCHWYHSNDSIHYVGIKNRQPYIRYPSPNKEQVFCVFNCHSIDILHGDSCHTFHRKPLPSIHRRTESARDWLRAPRPTCYADSFFTSYWQ